MNTSSQGALAEERTARYLSDKGYHILARNFHATGGEIDIVAFYNKILIFVEVKERASEDFGGPIMAVTHAKQKRIAQAALQFIKMNKNISHNTIRFDVVCILPKGIEHIENAFVPIRTTL